MSARLLNVFKFLLVALIMIGGISCSKTRMQRLRDDEIADRKKYLKENNISSEYRTNSGMYYIEQEEGEGELPKDGDKLYVWYTGYDLDGEIFDSNMENGKYEPLSFTFSKFGGREVIQGWYEGLGKMKEGGKARLIIPSSLAYGTTGYRNIPPYATLVFDIELMEIKRAEE